MFGYFIRRLLWFVPVLWVIATVTFFLMQAVPGGPFARDKDRPGGVDDAIDAKYGLDAPVWEQYMRYMQKLMRGDLGISFSNADRSVNDIIRETSFISIQIALLAIVFALLIGLTLGTIAALKHNGPIDYASVLFATVGASVPNFILAAFMSIVFAVNLGWLKLQGWGGPKNPGELFDFSVYEWEKMVIPVVALGVLPAAYIARVTRASILEVLNQDYIRTARAKGLRETRVVVRHTIKNALIPVLTVLGPITAVLISGSFIIETMFGIGGIGRESILAVQQRDYGLIMGTTLFFALIVASMNLAIDLMYAVVDPRIRYR
jgi:oligopeptide transport system permease protein